MFLHSILVLVLLSFLLLVSSPPLPPQTPPFRPGPGGPPAPRTGKEDLKKYYEREKKQSSGKNAAPKPNVDIYHELPSQIDYDPKEEPPLFTREMIERDWQWLKPRWEHFLATSTICHLMDENAVFMDTQVGEKFEKLMKDKDCEVEKKRFASMHQKSIFLKEALGKEIVLIQTQIQMYTSFQGLCETMRRSSAADAVKEKLQFDEIESLELCSPDTQLMIQLLQTRMLGLSGFKQDVLDKDEQTHLTMINDYKLMSETIHATANATKQKDASSDADVPKGSFKHPVPPPSQPTPLKDEL
jgi:hypothetical protein